MTGPKKLVYRPFFFLEYNILIMDEFSDLGGKNVKSLTHYFLEHISIVPGFYLILLMFYRWQLSLSEQPC